MADTPLREPPSRLGRWFLTAPSYLYKARLGWMLGNRFVMIEHTGRTSGRHYQTVLEVVNHDDDRWVEVAAAWGPTSDWFRNLKANPQAVVSMGRLRRHPAIARVLDPTEAEAEFAAYAEHHPKAAQALSKSMGLPFGDTARMAATVPMVRLTLD